MWNFVRDRAEGGQPAKQSCGTETSVLKPAGLLTAVPTYSAHSNTKQTRHFSPVGCPYANPK